MSLFKKVVSLLNSFQPIQVDPVLYGDERAFKVSWEPNSGGGASFKSAYLDYSQHHQITVKKSMGSKVFGAVFMFFGAIPLFFLVTKLEVFGLVGLIFVGVGYLVGFHDFNKIQFDTLRSRFTWKKNTYSYGQVVAVQIIEEWVRSNKSSFYSWELNLMLEDYKRITVIDHGDLEALRADAQKLAQTLNVEVWDASQDYLKRHLKRAS